MKAIAFLMAFYILFLGLVPCSDNSGENTGKDSNIAFVHNPHAQDTPWRLDFCSPLCTCSCCNIGIDQPQSFVTLALSTNFSVYDAIPMISHPKEIATSFWQPPKIA